MTHATTLPPLPELLSAMREVLRISDRKHDAWDRAKAALAALESTSPEDQQLADMHAQWADDDRRRAELLAQHLRQVLEVARTWQPDYATVMDRKTLDLAAAEVGHVAHQAAPVCRAEPTLKPEQVFEAFSRHFPGARLSDAWIGFAVDLWTLGVKASAGPAAQQAVEPLSDDAIDTILIQCGWMRPDAMDTERVRQVREAFRLTLNVAANTTHAPATPQAESVADVCKHCGGSGVDGDADDYGRTIDISCSSCDGSGKMFGVLRQARDALVSMNMTMSVHHCDLRNDAIASLNKALTTPPQAVQPQGEPLDALGLAAASVIGLASALHRIEAGKLDGAVQAITKVRNLLIAHGKMLATTPPQPVQPAEEDAKNKGPSLTEDPLSGISDNNSSGLAVGNCTASAIATQLPAPGCEPQGEPSDEQIYDARRYTNREYGEGVSQQWCRAFIRSLLALRASPAPDIRVSLKRDERYALPASALALLEKTANKLWGPNAPAVTDGERARFIRWLSETYPNVYDATDAERLWDDRHVSRLSWEAALRWAAGGQAGSPPTMTAGVVHICPGKDIVCGDKAANWCATCPKKGGAA